MGRSESKSHHVRSNSCVVMVLAAICDTDTVSLPSASRASPKPARLRLFLFPASPPATVGSGVTQSRSFGSEDSKSEKEVKEPEMPVHGVDDRMMGTDPIQNTFRICRECCILEEQCVCIVGKATIICLRLTGGDYWEKQVPGGVTVASSLCTEQPVYMIQAPGGEHLTPAPQFVGKWLTAGSRVHAVQRMPQEPYRDQPSIMSCRVYYAVPTVERHHQLITQDRQRVGGRDIPPQGVSLSHHHHNRGTHAREAVVSSDMRTQEATGVVPVKATQTSV
ncbi:hypothetical protein HAX54_016716 [Datura stramonium]|uniref:Uncharacterized protein n=1 Tax=Datura stramonium TaxID=4076 RepID=A0ABS8UMA6_DATST|nr:hypothetical protein [Datura stramonium]